MNVKGIMDLGGSQSTSKTSKSTSKSQAASSDLFKSIIGQKQAGSQQQSGLNVKTSAANAAGKPQQSQSQDKSAVQDTSTKDSASVNKGNDSAPADNLDNNAAVEDAPAAAPDAAASEEAEVAEEPVMEDEAEVTEESPAEEEKKADVPRQIFLMQMPVAATATIAPVIISSENYQASTVDTIANDITLGELPTQEPQVLMQVTEAEVVVSPNQIDVELGQLTVVAEAQDAPTQQQPVQQEAAPTAAPAATGQDAVVQITDSLQEAISAQPVQTAEAPQAPEQRPEAAPAAPTTEETVPVQAEQEAPLPEHEMVQAQPGTQEAAHAETEVLHNTTQPAAQRTDAADEFAAQVVKEAKDMVREQMPAEGAQEAAHAETEISRPVEGKADADDTDDAAGRNSDQNKSTTTQQTMPGTATVAEDGRVDLRTSAAQPLEAEQFLQPETRQMIMNRVVDQVRSAVSPDRTEFYIQLKPDFLGGLSIGLVAEEKGIVAKIMTTSQQVHSALQADMTALQRVLQERGINVVEMDVIYNQMADTTSKDNSDNRQQQFSQGGNNRSHGRISEQTEDALTMYDNTLTSQQVLTENGGSVEFTA